MRITEAHLLYEREEVIGDLNSIEITDMGLIAVIGQVSVLLPEELAEKLLGLKGRVIGILRLSGYHICVIDAPGSKHLPLEEKTDNEMESVASAVEAAATEMTTAQTIGEAFL